MVRLVRADLTGIEGERPQHFVASKQRHGDDGAILDVRFNLRSIEIQLRVAVVHRLTVGDDPPGYARSEDNTRALKALSVAPANMHRFYIDRVRLLEVKDASCIADYILQPRREDCEHVAQIQAAPNGLSYLV